MNRTLRIISQQNFVDQISNIWIINESRFFSFTRLFRSIHLFIARLWYAKLNKDSYSFLFSKSISKSHIKFQNRHRNSTFESFLTFENSKILQNHIYLSSKLAFVFCLDDNFNNISSHNLTSQNIQSVFNIYIIISFEESFDILFIYLANRSSFFVFAMSKYDISARRLRIFDNVKDWFSKVSTLEKLIVTEFIQNEYELIECCECFITWHKIILIEKKSVHKFSSELIKEIEQKTERVKRRTERTQKAQKQKKIQLTEQKIQEQTQREIKLTECQIKWKTKKRTELIEQI